jgi:hypothetical protein
MQFNIESPAERFYRNRQKQIRWHKHFCWWPTRVDNSEIVVWLEYVERRRHFPHQWTNYAGSSEYRLIKENKNVTNPS